MNKLATFDLNYETILALSELSLMHDQKVSKLFSFLVYEDQFSLLYCSKHNITLVPTDIEFDPDYHTKFFQQGVSINIIDLIKRIPSFKSLKKSTKFNFTIYKEHTLLFLRNKEYVIEHKELTIPWKKIIHSMEDSDNNFPITVDLSTHRNILNFIQSFNSNEPNPSFFGRKYLVANDTNLLVLQTNSGLLSVFTTLSKEVPLMFRYSKHSLYTVIDF